MDRDRTNVRRSLKAALLGSAAAGLIAGAAMAQEQRPISFNIAAQDAGSALNDFSRQAGIRLLFPYDAVEGKRAPAVRGDMTASEALGVLTKATGLVVAANDGTVVTLAAPQSQSAAGGGAEVEALIVTAQKREEDIQDVPIAISAFTQEQLERSQVAGGPDLMTQIPNMTFTKTNFSTYSIQIRGIGTQAISATTDAAVAVAFNNTPFIRNRFFEQEFYDLQRVEVLRGPQGTLYGRNATAGVVNIISQKPKFGYEAKLSGDISNYNSTRLEGMINVPLVDDKVALRLAGAWTKREGYSTNEITGNPIDGRDLWSTRLSLRFSPNDRFDANVIWEHFEEEDDRLRSGKQLCHQDDREALGYLTIPQSIRSGTGGIYYYNMFNQGCLPASLYAPESLEAPNGYSLPYYLPIQGLGAPIKPGFNPYASLVQSPNLRVIESTVDPKYRANTDLVELQWAADISEGLTLSSETSYNYDTIFSLQDYNRFNTARGAFVEETPFPLTGRPNLMQVGEFGAVFCDPQVGCADRLVAIDVSRAKSSQFSQEFRLSSGYEGAFNFSVGANYLRYDTEDKYYVFINTLTMLSAVGNNTYSPWAPGVTDNSECLRTGMVAPNPATFQNLSTSANLGCQYLDPNPIESVNDLGHNYFLSRNPYKLISYAVFGEAYYNITDALKLTAGLRWTVDKKEAPRIPSMLLAQGNVGLSVLSVEEQEWREPTGRLAIDWKPNLPFSDETLLYASYAHGYKAGGSNPPPSTPVVWMDNIGDQLVQGSALKPKTFEAEFVDAFEVGSKNILLDGRMTLNLAAFYYDYKGYQVSQIIDRSAVNYNFDSEVWGLEIEADWRPLENLRLGFKGGYQNTRIGDGERAIDIMERNYGHGPDSEDPWIVARPFPTFPSNCVLPLSVYDKMNGSTEMSTPFYVWHSGWMGQCEYAYAFNADPVTLLPYVPYPTDAATAFGYTSENWYHLADAGWMNYPGFNPLDESMYAPGEGFNHGEGFFKPLGGNELPNAPHFTATITADYTVPLPSDWLATLHTDLYYQSEAWTRVFNMEGYDKLKAFTNVNVAAIFTNEDAGWKVMAYVKNVFDRDSITGAFLNSDDSGLTTNIFLTEPRLYGLRVTKEFSGGPWWTGGDPAAHGPFPLTVELSGQAQRQDAPYAPVAPDFVDTFMEGIDPISAQNRDLDWGDGREVRLTYRPGGDWSIMGGVRYGRNNKNTPVVHLSGPAGPGRCPVPPSSPIYVPGVCDPENPNNQLSTGTAFADSTAREREEHTVADFAVGRDVGLGLLGDSSSTFSVGLRYASFESTTQAWMDGTSNWYIPNGFFKYDTATRSHYQGSLTATREFTGTGPTLSWDAAQRLFGNEETGEVSLDWSITGGVLYGKQKSTVVGTLKEEHTEGKYGIEFGDMQILAPLVEVPLDVAPRSKSVTVPVLDLSLGLSYEISRVKVGAGYRWERYFDVLDVGYDEHQDADRTIDGPYFKIAVGFGG
jgi:outer membrane receptor protein involved in Fe transport